MLRVSSRVAVAQSPARSAARTRVEEITPSPSVTGATASAGNPSAAKLSIVPLRARPKVKSCPVTTAATPSCSTSKRT